jgi:hypothetical protein
METNQITVLINAKKKTEEEQNVDPQEEING